jgi:hypothetical protein
MDTGEIMWESVDWIQFTQDKDKWRDLADIIMNLSIFHRW